MLILVSSMCACFSNQTWNSSMVYTRSCSRACVTARGTFEGGSSCALSSNWLEIAFTCMHAIITLAINDSLAEYIKTAYQTRTR